MKPAPFALAFAVAAASSACTYGIVLDSGGQRVRTAWNGDVAACRDIGKISVSVLSRVGPIDRNDIKVRDELEVMARNQAAQMRADTVKPLGEPVDGGQSWEAYVCTAAVVPMPAASSAPSTLPAQPAQTFPAPGDSG